MILLIILHHWCFDDVSGHQPNLIVVPDGHPTINQLAKMSRASLICQSFSCPEPRCSVQPVMLIWGMSLMTGHHQQGRDTVSTGITLLPFISTLPLSSLTLKGLHKFMCWLIYRGIVSPPFSTFPPAVSHWQSGHLPVLSSEQVGEGCTAEHLVPISCCDKSEKILKTWGK